MTFSSTWIFAPVSAEAQLHSREEYIGDSFLMYYKAYLDMILQGFLAAAGPSLYLKSRSGQLPSRRLNFSKQLPRGREEERGRGQEPEMHRMGAVT